jgi:hypothetical protein
MNTMRERESEKIRLGVSSCLLGAEVRYDGGHKKDALPEPRPEGADAPEPRVVR